MFLTILAEHETISVMMFNGYTSLFQWFMNHERHIPSTFDVISSLLQRTSMSKPVVKGLLQFWQECRDLLLILKLANIPMTPPVGGILQFQRERQVPAFLNYCRSDTLQYCTVVAGNNCPSTTVAAGSDLLIIAMFQVFFSHHRINLYTQFNNVLLW